MMADQPNGQPPAPAEDGEAGKEYHDARDESEAAAHCSQSHPAEVERLVDDGQKRRNEPVPGHRRPSITATVTVTLPDDLLILVFGFCDARARMMAIPTVSRRWLGVCQHLMLHADIDLAWAIRNFSCALTDAGLAGLVNRFPTAATIKLGFCRSVTDGGLGAVAAGCPNLQHLDLSDCRWVTDGGLRAVAAGCPSLQHLNLASCGELTDGGLGAVAAGCPSLQHLDLSYCWVVMDGGLGAIAAGCSSLQHLGLKFCEPVTDGEDRFPPPRDTLPSGPPIPPIPCPQPPHRPKSTLPALSLMSTWCNCP